MTFQVDKHTITSDHKELIILCNFMRSYIRISSDNLLFRCEICALLKFEITQRTGQREVAIDSAIINETASSTYSSFFTCSPCEKLEWSFMGGGGGDWSHEPSFCGL